MGQEKMVTTAAVGVLLLVAGGIVGWKAYLVTPHSKIYRNVAQNYTLLIPASWGDHYNVNEQGTSVLFMYQPNKGTPALIFAVEKTSVAAWQVISQDKLTRPVSQELWRRGDEVYYARWSANNPYSGSEARKYLALARDVSQVLASFTLDIETQAKITEPAVCIQVITPSRNTLTGEIKEFPTPCDVPQGWEIIRP